MGEHDDLPGCCPGSAAPGLRRGPRDVYEVKALVRELWGEPHLSRVYPGADMSGPNVEDPINLPPIPLDFYRRMMAAHTPDQATKLCPICETIACDAYQYAYNRLMDSKEPL